MGTIKWKPALTAEELAAAEAARIRKEFKDSRRKLVEAIKVTTTTGNTFDGDEISQNRMARVLIAMPADETVTWVLADNSTIQATKEELAEAIYLAGKEQEALWLQE